MSFGAGAIASLAFAETSEILTVVTPTGVYAEVALGTVTVLGHATAHPFPLRSQERRWLSQREFTRQLT
jgi:hypothetical protein